MSIRPQTNCILPPASVLWCRKVRRLDQPPRKYPSAEVPAETRAAPPKRRIATSLLGLTQHAGVAGIHRLSAKKASNGHEDSINAMSFELSHRSSAYVVEC